MILKIAQYVSFLKKTINPGTGEGAQQLIEVQMSAPIAGDSQTPLTPSPKDPEPLWPSGALAHTYVHSRTESQ